MYKTRPFKNGRAWKNQEHSISYEEQSVPEEGIWKYSVLDKTR